MVVAETATVGCDSVVLPTEAHELLDVIWPRAVELIESLPSKGVEMLVADDDVTMQRRATGGGFRRRG